VIGDGADNADIARTAAVLDVPGGKFHAPLVADRVLQHSERFSAGGWARRWISPAPRR
jgi:hypothetical protein